MFCVQVLFLVALKAPDLLSSVISPPGPEGLYAVSRTVADAAMSAWKHKDEAAQRKAAGRAAQGFRS